MPHTAKSVMPKGKMGSVKPKHAGHARLHKTGGHKGADFGSLEGSHPINHAQHEYGKHPK